MKEGSQQTMKIEMKGNKTKNVPCTINSCICLWLFARRYLAVSYFQLLILGATFVELSKSDEVVFKHAWKILHFSQSIFCTHQTTPARQPPSNVSPLYQSRGRNCFPLMIVFYIPSLLADNGVSQNNTLLLRAHLFWENYSGWPKKFWKFVKGD